MQFRVIDRIGRTVTLLRPLRAPAIPRVPRLLAYAALREPRLVPIRLRWRAASDGLGLVVARLLGEGEGASAGAVLEGIGEEQGRALREQLGYGHNPMECARAVALANRLVGIRARARATTDGRGAEVVTPGCPWSREEWWGRAPCGAFSRYEVGLTRGLNPAVRLRYRSKRTRGDTECIGVYTDSEGGD